MAQQPQQKKKRSPPVQILPNKQKLPMIAIGTAKIQDEHLLTNLLRAGLQLGYSKHIDTARLYNNQIPLGKAIKTVISEDRCKREDLFIATKTFNHVLSDPVLEIKEALRLMQLEYVDLYYLHWPVVDMDPKGEKFLHRSLEEVWELMELCVKKGYTKHLGISNFNGQLLTQLLTFCKIKPIALQIQIHPYLMQQSLVQTSQKSGIHVLACSPLARCGSYNQDYNILKQQQILQLSSKYNKTPAQIVLKSALYRNIGVIPKTTNLGRLRDNWECWNFQINQEDMKKIRNIGAGVGRKVKVCSGKFGQFDVFDF